MAGYLNKVSNFGYFKEADPFKCKFCATALLQKYNMWSPLKSYVIGILIDDGGACIRPQIATKLMPAWCVTLVQDGCDC